MSIQRFADKVALITGGNSGIGRATALAFAREGANVVIAGRRVKEGRETVDLIKKVGGHAVFIPTDVSQAKDVESLVSHTIEAFGKIDYAFNNAGTEVGMGPMAELTEAHFDQNMSVNLKGVWLCMRYEIPAMLRNQGGVIVNNASIAGVIGFPGTTIYGAAKAGVIGMTRAAAIEHAKTGIRINAVAPGPVQTEMLSRALGSQQAIDQVIAAKVPAGRVGTSEEIADAVLWLCLDGAAFVTGQVLNIDGGYTAQ